MDYQEAAEWYGFNIKVLDFPNPELGIPKDLFIVEFSETGEVERSLTKIGWALEAVRARRVLMPESFI